MKSKKSFVPVVAIIALFGLGNLAYAVPITFTHSGSGSGSIAGIPFLSTSFTITAFGDTTARVPTGVGFFIDHSAATISITGLGTLNFITGTRTFINQPSQIPGFSRAGITGTDLFNGPSDPTFAGWDMLSSIGPVAGAGELLQWQDVPLIFTDSGQLIFTDSISAATFEAVVAVPEPATLLLLSSGLLGFGVFRKRFN